MKLLICRSFSLTTVWCINHQCQWQRQHVQISFKLPSNDWFVIPRTNKRMQHFNTTVNATYCNSVAHSMLHTLVYLVARCWVVQPSGQTFATCWAKQCCNILRWLSCTFAGSLNKTASEKATQWHLPGLQPGRLDLAPVVRRLDNAIHRINCYPVDKR